MTGVSSGQGEDAGPVTVATGPSGGLTAAFSASSHSLGQASGASSQPETGKLFLQMIKVNGQISW